MCQLTYISHGVQNSQYYFIIILIFIGLGYIERIYPNITFLYNILFKKKGKAVPTVYRTSGNGYLLELLFFNNTLPYTIFPTLCVGKIYNLGYCNGWGNYIKTWFNICFVNPFEVSVLMISNKSNCTNVGNLRLPFNSLRQGNRTIIVPDLNIYSIYNISNIMLKGRIVAKTPRAAYFHSSIHRIDESKAGARGEMEIKQFNNPFFISSPVAKRLGIRKYGKRSFYKSTTEKIYNLINNLNSRKPIKISLSNILSDRNYFLVENNFQY